METIYVKNTLDLPWNSVNNSNNNFFDAGFCGARKVYFSLHDIAGGDLHRI